jgi:RimJ/RimL family protein N-acetyltransferase
MITVAPTLETARFRLRAATRADFEGYAAMWADPRVTVFIGGDPRDRNSSWHRFLEIPGLWALLGFGYWVFTDIRDDSFVGCGGLSDFERGIPELVGYPEAGWAITPDWWGKGAASEIIGAALAWADTVLGVAEVRCIISPDNGASERVAEKLGFKPIGFSDVLADPVTIFARAALAI